MYEYDDECLLTFLKKQSQLFDEPVAETHRGSGGFPGGMHGRSRGFP